MGVAHQQHPRAETARAIVEAILAVLTDEATERGYRFDRKRITSNPAP